MKNKNILPLKVVDEQKVPVSWRNTLSQIVESFKDGDFCLSRNISGVEPISSEDAEAIAESIEEYGEELISLPKETWKTSACLWMDGFWDVFVDLYTIEEGASDLVLSVRVYEQGSDYVFKVHFVHVP